MSKYKEIKEINAKLDYIINNIDATTGKMKDDYSTLSIHFNNELNEYSKALIKAQAEIEARGKEIEGPKHENKELRHTSRDSPFFSYDPGAYIG